MIQHIHDETDELAELVGKRKVISPRYAQTEDFSADELTALEERGIVLDSIQRLGDGQTRTAYSGAQVIQEPFITQCSPVTITIPKSEIDPESVCTAINKSKRDVDLNESEVLGQIGWHPNIISSMDSITPDGRRININGYAEGVDLEELVQSRGPIKENGVARQVISQLLGGLGYFHDRGYLHRDVKPSNVFVDPFIYNEGNHPEAVKIGDGQNAARIDQIEELTMPTRGGTAYTHRNLLNALATGEPSKASEKTDVHALGGTLFYMFTGKDPSDYRIVRDEEGREVNIGNETFRVGLVRKSSEDEVVERMERIPEDVDEARLNQMVGQVPRAYQGLVYGCLTDNPEYSFETVGEVRQYFENPISNKLTRLGGKVTDKLRNLGQRAYEGVRSLFPEETPVGAQPKLS